MREKPSCIRTARLELHSFAESDRGPVLDLLCNEEIKKIEEIEYRGSVHVCRCCEIRKQ